MKALPLSPLIVFGKEDAIRPLLRWTCSGRANVLGHSHGCMVERPKEGAEGGDERVRRGLGDVLAVRERRPVDDGGGPGDRVTAGDLGDNRLGWVGRSALAVPALERVVGGQSRDDVEPGDHDAGEESFAVDRAIGQAGRRVRPRFHRADEPVEEVEG